MGLFSGEYSVDELNKRQGDFFEGFVRAIYGGELNQPIVFFGEDHEKPVTGLIDIIDKDGNYREVKSIRTGARLRLMDRQVSRFAYALAVNKSLPHYSSKDSPRIIYDVVRHRVRDIKKRFAGIQDAGEMLSEFGQNTRSMISIDFPIIYNLWDPRNSGLSRQNGYHYEYGGHYGALTFLPGSSLTRLLIEPLSELSSLGVDPELCEIHHYKSHRRLRIEGEKAHKFPILTITLKNPEQWRKNHMSQDPEWMKDYFDLSSDAQGSEQEDDAQGDISFDPEELERMPVSEPIEMEDDLPF
jgi:hypothetical protein